MKLKKAHIIFLVLVVLVVNCMPVINVTASGGVSNKIAQLEAKYPTGSFFSADGKACSHGQLQTCSNCRLSSISADAANVCINANTCLAFARYTFWYIFGLSPDSQSFQWSTIDTINSIAKIGDFITFYDSSGNYYHSAIYLGADTNGFYAYTSNYTCANDVKYNRLYNSGKYLTSKYKVFHASNYDAINGTSYSPTLTIKYDTNGGYINDKKASSYYQDSKGLIYRTSNSAYYTTVMTYGVSHANGFVNASTLGVVRDGYVFKGWSLKSSGGTTYNQDGARYPEDIYPDLKNGSATITMYAVWKPNELTMKYNSNGGYINDTKSSTYYLDDDDLIYRVSNDVYYSSVWKYGITVDTGFVDNTTFGIVKDGYIFAGWSFSKKGGKVYDKTSARVPEEVYPDLIKGNTTVTMYAAWEECNHSYDNNCDTSCNLCGAVRTITHNYSSATCTKAKTCTVCGATSGRALGHKYSNACDKTCNVCNAVRTVPAHKYTNNCDASCNVCGATRTITHNYSSATCTKAKACTVCGAINGRALGHKYSNACDKTCNVCNAVRTVPVHKYTNNCDTGCNVCGDIRKITHLYKTTTTKATLENDGEIVKKCSVCGDIYSITTIKYPKTIKLSKSEYTYNGEAKKPSVTVKDSSGKKLTEDKDYTVTYPSGRKKVGSYKVKVKFKGNYSGTEYLTFKINPKTTKVSSVSAGKKSLKVKIKKQSSQTTGYEVQYSTSKKFSSAKTKKITSNKTTSVTLKSLKAKKTYYVRVRTYKTVNGKRYYSAWSSYKSKKTK